LKSLKTHFRPDDTAGISRKGSGLLYVVATPIGNLEDITFRAINVLKQVDLIAAEDTRHTGKLLSHYCIKKAMVSCHEHNEASRIPELIDRLKNGQMIALVSDAGTPSVSDPGYRLVRAVVKAGLAVVPIPGPSAAVAGLSVSGLPTDSFLFAGFMARKKGKRQKDLERLSHETSTLVFYESPRRIVLFVEELVDILGDRPAMLAREITKIHEEFIRGSLSEILAALRAKTSVKGECALFVAGCGKDKGISQEDLDNEIFQALQDPEIKTSVLAKKLSIEFGLSKKKVYDRIIQLLDR